MVSKGGVSFNLLGPLIIDVFEYLYQIVLILRQLFQAYRVRAIYPRVRTRDVRLFLSPISKCMKRMTFSKKSARKNERIY